MSSQLTDLCRRLTHTAEEIEGATTDVHEAGRRIGTLAEDIRALVASTEATEISGQQVIALLTAAARECNAAAAALLTAAAHGKSFVSRTSRAS